MNDPPALSNQSETNCTVAEGETTDSAGDESFRRFTCTCGAPPRAEAKRFAAAGEKTGVQSIVGLSVTLEGFPPRARSNTSMSVVPARLSMTSAATNVSSAESAINP